MKKFLNSVFKIVGSVALLSLAFGLVSCRKNKVESSSDKKVLTYSKSAGPYTVLFEEAIQPILEAKGYKFKGYDYSDLGLADDALAGGDVDFNVEQHSAYAENYNKSNNTDLVPITPIPTVPASLFSSRHSSLDEIKKIKSPTIAVPNDASNTARAYVLLQKVGWIKLREDVNLATATSDDIIENPYGIKFTEMRSITIPPVSDDFDYIVITGSIVYNAGIDPSTALAQETVLPHLILQVVVKEANVNTQWAKDLVEAYHSDEFKKWYAKNNTGLWWIPEGYFN